MLKKSTVLIWNCLWMTFNQDVQTILIIENVVSRGQGFFSYFVYWEASKYLNVKNNWADLKTIWWSFGDLWRGWANLGLKTRRSKFCQLHVIGGALTLCHPQGDFSCFFVICRFFFKISFSKNSFRNIIRVSNSLDPDQVLRFVRPGLGPNCLQRLSADNFR